MKEELRPTPGSLRELAHGLAVDVAKSHPEVGAVLLIGSVAQNRESKDSDIDIAILVESNHPPRPVFTSIEGVMVGYEYFSLNDLRALPESPLLDQRYLRDAARLANGILVYQSAEDLQSILSKLRSSRLCQEDAEDLFTTCAHLGKALCHCRSQEAQMWVLQGMAVSLSVLALNLTSNRFQKPKWLFQDLHAVGELKLLNVVESVFPPRGGTEQQSAATLRTVTSYIERGFKFLGLPKPQYSGNDHDLDYIYRTFADAHSLFQSKHWKAAGFVATMAARLMYTLLLDRLPQCFKHTDSDMRIDHIASELKLSFDPVGLTSSQLLELLHTEAHRLHRLYYDQYQKDDDSTPKNCSV